MTYTGQCLCKAVRFTAESAETHHHACHCGMCRRWSGPFAGELPQFTEAETLAKFSAEP